MPDDFYSILLQKTFDTWWRLAEGKFRRHTLRKPSISLSKRMTVTLGTAWPDRNVIRISANQFERYPAFFCRDLIAHELAHILAWQIYKYGKPGEVHGEPWKKICRTLGIEPINLYDWEHIERA